MLRSSLLGLFAGVVLSLFLASTVYYFAVQEPAIRRRDVENFPQWPWMLIVSMGAILGVVMGVTVGRRPLPPSVKHGSFGALVAIAILVVVTHMVIGNSKGIPGVRYIILVGIPLVAVLGACIGVWIGKREWA